MARQHGNPSIANIGALVDAMILRNTIRNIGITALTIAAVGASIYLGYAAYRYPIPVEKPAEIQRKEHVRVYPYKKEYHIDAIVEGKSYEQADVPAGKKVEKYQIVVRKILTDKKDFRMNISKDALDDFLAIFKKSEVYDKEQKTFDSGRGYYPIEIAALSQALAENDVITKESIKKKQDKTGYKQIVGAE